MSAAPAYSRYPKRAPEQAPRARISVVPGSGKRTQTSTLPSNVVFLAKAIAMVLLFVAVVAFARIGLMAAAISTSIESSQLSAQIEEVRSSSAALEVSQSVLSNPTRVREEAAELGMVEATDVSFIAMPQDVVVTDESGTLSLSQSVATAAIVGV